MIYGMNEPSNRTENLPKIIQGGMGVNVSNPQLAAAVSGASQDEQETL